MDNELKFEQKGSQSIYISIARNLRFHELRPKSKPEKDRIFKSETNFIGGKKHDEPIYNTFKKKKKTLYMLIIL